MRIEDFPDFEQEDFSEDYRTPLVQYIISKLSLFEQQIMFYFYDINKSEYDLAHLLHIKRKTIYNYRKRALRKIRLLYELYSLVPPFDMKKYLKQNHKLIAQNFYSFYNSFYNIDNFNEIMTNANFEEPYKDCLCKLYKHRLLFRKERIYEKVQPYLTIKKTKDSGLSKAFEASR